MKREWLPINNIHFCTKLPLFDNRFPFFDLFRLNDLEVKMKSNVKIPKAESKCKKTLLGKADLFEVELGARIKMYF
jgi:hypothetical protein